MRVTSYVACCLVVTAACQSSALACQPRVPAKTAEEVRQRAKESFSAADAVIDAKVIVAANTDPTIEGVMQMTVLEPLKVWKGETAEIVPVISLTMCDNLLGHRGARYRLLVSRVGDSDLFTVSATLNEPSAAGGTTFGQEIDRLIGNPRPKNFVGVYESGPSGSISLPDSHEIESPRPMNKWAMLLLGAAVAALSSIATWFVMRRRISATGG